MRSNYLLVLADGRLASGNIDGKISLTNVSNDQTVYLSGHTKSVFALAALSSETLVSGSNDETVKVWNTTSSGLLSTIKKQVKSLTVLPNGLLASILTQQYSISAIHQFKTRILTEAILIWNPYTGELS